MSATTAEPTTEPTTEPTRHGELMTSRPRVRRDILFTEVPEGVLFHDATSGFRVHGRTAYRFASLVVPYLDGTATVAQLCAGLGEQQLAMVESLVRSLYDHGFARAVLAPEESGSARVDDAVRRRFDAQIAYVDHHVDDAEARFARFRNTRVAILGDDEVAAWAARSLVRNGACSVGVRPTLLTADLEAEATALREEGCPVDLRADASLAEGTRWEDLARFDVVVVTPSEQCTRTFLALVASGVPNGVRLLPCWQAGDDVVVGPSLRAGTTGCWVCAALRVGATGEPGAAADLWSGLVGSRPTGRRPVGPVAAMLGNLLAYEIFRLTTGALPGETDGTVVVQDLDSLDSVVEPVLPHPRCPACAPSSTRPAGTELAPASASPQPGKPIPEPGGPEAERQLADLHRRMALVGARLGLVTELDDDLLEQTPLRVTTARVALGHGRRRRIAAVDVHNVAGARIAALAAAAATYADRVLPVTVTTNESGDLPTVPPSALVTYGGLDETVDAWVRATALSTGRTALVPAAAVAPYSDHNARRTFTASSAGTGVDDDEASARGAALLSALAYDAVVTALRGRRTVTRLVLDERDDDPVLTFLVRTAGHLGVDVDLLNLGADLPAPVVLARTTDPRTGTPVWTAAADTTRRAASVTALRDLLGRIQLGGSLPADEEVDAGDPLVADLAPDTIAAPGQQPWSDRTVTFAGVLERLRADGVEAYAVDRHSPDLAAAGLAVARVLLTRADGAH